MNFIALDRPCSFDTKNFCLPKVTLVILKELEMFLLSPTKNSKEEQVMQCWLYCNINSDQSMIEASRHFHSMLRRRWFPHHPPKITPATLIRSSFPLKKSKSIPRSSISQLSTAPTSSSIELFDERASTSKRVLLPSSRDPTRQTQLSIFRKKSGQCQYNHS